MNVFAEVLRQGPRWRRVVVPAVAVAGIGIAGAVSLSEPAPCVGVSARVEQAWGGGARGVVEVALVDRDPDAVQRILGGLDAYASEVAAAQLRACTAHRVEGTRSDTLFDLQMRCLDARVVALETVSAKVPDSEVARAIEAVVSLPSTEDCEDVERLSARAPVAPADREIVDAAASVLAEARVVAKLGDASQAMELVTAAREDLGERHPPLRAELTCFVADMHVSASDHDAAAESFQRCADEAATAQDDALLSYAWIQLVGIDGVYRGHYDAALARTDMLRTILQRAGDPPRARGQYFHVLGLVRERAGQLEQAQADLRTAIESFREAGAREDHAAALQSLAASLYNQGQPGESAPLLREALEVNRALYGPTHERVLASELNTIIVEIEDSGEEADALGELTTRIDASLGTKHRLAVHVRRNRGDALRTAGRPEESVAVLEEAVKIASDVFGEQHATVAELHQLLAEGHRVLHRYEDAVASARRALEMQALLYPNDHPDLAQSHETLAEALRSAGRAEQSVAEFEEAIRLSGRPPMDPVMQSRALTGLGLALLDLARREEACAALRRALELADAPDLPRVRLAEALIDHAKCVAVLGDWPRAQTDAERGLEVYRAIEGHDPSMLADYELMIARAYRPHAPLRDRANDLEAAVDRWLTANTTHPEYARIRAALTELRAAN
jgi:tetratricopeptide (TPR) repeat protein